MKIMFPVSLLVLMALLTGTLSNHRFMAKIKASFSTTEVELSAAFDSDKILDPDRNILISTTLIEIDEHILHPVVDLPYVKKKPRPNPSLNSLYRAHSPPLLS